MVQIRVMSIVETAARVVMAVVAMVTLVAVAGCDRRVAGGVADGSAVFLEACARCHGDHGVPPPAMAAQLGVRDLSDAGFQAGISDRALRQRIADGSQAKGMPAFSEILTEAQLDAVADHVRTLVDPQKNPQ